MLHDHATNTITCPVIRLVVEASGMLHGHTTFTLLTCFTCPVIRQVLEASGMLHDHTTFSLLTCPVTRQVVEASGMLTTLPSPPSPVLSLVRW